MILCESITYAVDHAMDIIFDSVAYTKEHVTFTTV